jgi:hypothetical protein
MPYVYTLTSLTGRNRNAGRTTIVWGFEFGRRALVVTSVAVGASLLPALIASVFFGGLAFIVVPAMFIVAAFVFVEGRTRNGLQVRLYQSILDKKNAQVDVFYICFRPVKEMLGRANLVASSVPVETCSEDVVPARAAVFSNAAQKPARGTTIATLLEDVQR